MENKTDSKWRVQSVGDTAAGEDDGDYIDEVTKAFDASEAVRISVASWWSEDLDELPPTGMKMKARRAGGNVWKYFTVSGECAITWKAREYDSDT